MLRMLKATLLAAALLALVAAPPVAAEDAFASDLSANLESTGKKLIDLAKAIPAEHYGWSPTVHVRTVSEVFMHVVGVNMLLPAALGAPLPDGMEPPANAFATMQEWERTYTTKDEVVAKLEESFTYVQGAVGKVTDLDEKVTLFGPPQTKRAYLFIILGHAHEHLGQGIAYTRGMGLVPPWSQGGGGDGDS